MADAARRTPSWPTADELVGYETYLGARARAAAASGRHATDNRVEGERARHALELAAGGARVAVVSSGDPGIFAMAAAVLEVVDGDAAFADVELRIVPGLSAMQAAAARVGRAARPRLLRDLAVGPAQAVGRWSSAACDAAGAADLVLALYNPASRTRREQLDARARGAAPPPRAGHAGRRRARGGRAPRSRSRSRRSAASTPTRSTCARC